LLFHSANFLELFAVTFAVYWVLRSKRLRMAALLVASVFYYTRASRWLVVLLLATGLFD
jgi:hypothetical protein